MAPSHTEAENSSGVQTGESRAAAYRRRPSGPLLSPTLDRGRPGFASPLRVATGAGRSKAWSFFRIHSRVSSGKELASVAVLSGQQLHRVGSFLLQLIERALARGLVRAPAQEGCSVTKSLAAEMVVSHLDHEFRP